MEGAEHAWIGDQITLTYRVRGNLPAKRFPLNISSRHLLTYGQLIALGGDFYGVVGAPISTATEPGKAFIDAWNSLVTADDAEVKAILAIMDEEIAAVEKAQADGQEPSTAYHELGDKLSARWNRLTGGGSVVSDFLPPGRYLQLSSENWDHFNTFAVTAYTVGHDNATYLASLAAEQPEDVQDAYLEEAYAMNAFADHFLTDLFSAGHVRAPRKALTDILSNWHAMAGGAGGLLTRSMHDEDGEHGLNVINANKTRWKAYGDKKLLDSCSVDNRRQVVAAVQASADDVWEAFRGGKHQRSALTYIPDLQAAQSVSTWNNPSPLFRIESDRPGQVYRRRDMANREDFTWTNDWNPLDTLLELYGGHPYTKVKCFDPVTKKSLGWLTKGGNNYLQLTDNVEGVHPCSWYVTSDGSLYLRKETSGTINGRFLGRERSNADWELQGSPVIYNPDGTISLKDDPKRRLCVGDDSWIYWTDDDAPNPHLLGIDLPLGPAITP